VIRLPTVPPLWYQIPALRAFDLGKRRQIKSYPRRHGKDFVDLMIMQRESMIQRGAYYYVFPTRRWGERAIWETMSTIGDTTKPIIEWMFPKEYCKLYVSDLRVEINGKYGVSKFFMGGTDNLDFVGQGGQGYGMSEFSLHKREATGLLSPIIRQSQALLLLNGTMRGKKNPLYEILEKTKGSPEWYSTWLVPEQTKLYCWVNSAEEINVNPELVPLIGATDPKTGDLYKNCQGVPYFDVQSDIDAGLISFTSAAQEYLNRADGDVAGGYYTYELKKLAKDGRKRPIDPHSDIVYTFWDLGGAGEKTDKTAIVFAHVNTVTKDYRVVDYYENRGKLRGHYWDVVNSKRYSYGGHFYPHDGKKANVWTGETSGETAEREFGAEIRYVPKTQNTMNDIEIVRRGMAHTSFAGDNPGVEVLLDALGHYHENEGTGAPCHRESCRECNGASHGADAFRYMHMAIHLGIVEPYLLKNTKEWNWWDKKPTEDDIYDAFYT
jgi:hypothetical protein